jgi:hypothetical protein
MFPNYSFEPERGLVVHLVADQVHVTKFSNSTNVAVKPRGVTCVDLKIFSNLNWSLPSSFLQLKTGVKSTLTSQIKELGAILQKLIKFEPGLIQIDKHDEHLSVDGDADVLTLGEKGAGLGATTERKLFFHKN